MKEVSQEKRKPRSVISLFTGAGGLDLGLETAGFRNALCVEIDPDSRETLARNRPKWRLATPGDVHALHPEEILEQASLSPGEATLLAGGPPCQPFSKSGYWFNGDAAGLSDPRAATLRAYLHILRVALPEVLLLENVRGLAFSKKSEGLTLLLRSIDRINRDKGTAYAPVVLTLNAADYGVPQMRERVFLIAHRDGLPFEAPAKTHVPPWQEVPSERQERYRSAWDAIGDLDGETWPEYLDATGKWADLLPSIPEGDNYLWHTERGRGLHLFGWRTRYWSFLLKLSKAEPSWTIQADPGPATGPFHWKSRKLSNHELARIQTFPDDYEIQGERRSVLRQIGNAVPPAIGELLGLAIRRQFLGEYPRTYLTLIPSERPGCPPPEKRKPVPPRFKGLIGRHLPHPGTGMGPRALQWSQEEEGV